ncbi:hypothetical protein DY000_02009514 [Brassica cretica]|uniref:Uncharacterized protein n=1 Tax=Brassica cretica TaxID=69181 RepID=A0ABQ7BV60_BRACR|nr:hypothetical protein DY000_02009514 [Brassica cretica]
MVKALLSRCRRCWLTKVVRCVSCLISIAVAQTTNPNELKSAERLNASKTFPWEKVLDVGSNVPPRKEIFNREIASLPIEVDMDMDSQVLAAEAVNYCLSYFCKLHLNVLEYEAQVETPLFRRKELLNIYFRSWSSTTLKRNENYKRKQMIRPRLLRSYLYHQTKQFRADFYHVWSSIFKMLDYTLVSTKEEAVRREDVMGKYYQIVKAISPAYGLLSRCFMRPMRRYLLLVLNG